MFKFRKWHTCNYEWYRLYRSYENCRRPGVAILDMQMSNVPIISGYGWNYWLSLIKLSFHNAKVETIWPHISFLNKSESRKQISEIWSYVLNIKKKQKKRVMPIISSNYSLCHSLNSHLTRSRNESYFPHCVKLNLCIWKTENSTTSHSSFESFFKLGVYMSFYEDLKWDFRPLFCNLVT